VKKNELTLPVVTVLMSCYNGEKWLGDVIESVLNQTFRDFEFVIVDDGSRDKSLEIMKGYSAKDSRIRIIKKENTGLPDSLNAGIKIAKGDWIARIDTDDLCEPQRLEKQMDFAISDPEIVLIGTAYHEIDEQGSVKNLQLYPETHPDLKKNLLRKKRFFAHSSAFYKTKIVREIGGYRPRIKKSEDYDLWLRLADTGKMACIPEPLIRFRTHPDQISHEDSGRRQIADGRVALTSYWIRKFGFTDPVEQSDEDFKQFREWVVHKITEAKLFEYREFVGSIKSQIANKNFVKVIGSCFFNPGFVLRHIVYVIRGETISRKLAREWVQSNNKLY